MKYYLVTGASRGIGKAAAQLLLQNGDFVYGTYNTNRDSAEKLKEVSENVELYPCDLSKYAEIDDFAEKLKSKKLDGIVNSAGVFEEVDFNNFDPASFEKNFKINAFAPLYLVQKLQNQLNENSSIVNISSTDENTGSYTGIGYSASKAAISNVTKSLALILSLKKIRVNAIAPGWIGDGMKAPDELLKLAADYNPLKRNGTYEELADLVSYLLSDKSSYVNGTIIVADGGDMTKSYILEKESEL